ncbi:Cation-transporting P-type ATPase, C-terminal [Dillenia turbinata]|uniref:Cation-transporting P-type ATPase, C-terminal n=1 Tax=Dillenia turbinata TaxID=194707 RepID=A0AAN8W365_9MAGN
MEIPAYMSELVAASLEKVFNEINSRDIDKINVFRGMSDSWIFLGVMVSTVVFQFIIVEYLGTFASTVPLSWQLWLISVLLGSISLPVGAVLKCIPVERSRPEHYDGYEQLPSGPDMA